MRKIYVSRVSVPHTSMLLTVKYAKALLKKEKKKKKERDKEVH